MTAFAKENIDRKDRAIVGTFYQFLATSSSFFAGSAFYIYLAKFYTTTDVGNVALLIAMVGIFSTVFSLGLSQASQHFISFYLGKKEYHHIRAFVRKTIKYGLLSALLGMLSLLTLSGMISGAFFHSSSFVSVIMVLALYLLAYILFYLFTGILLGMQNFRTAARISMLTSFLSYSLAGLLLYNFRSPVSIVVGWLSGYSLGAVILGIMVLKRAGRYKENGEPFLYKPVLAYSAPIIFSGIMGTAATYVDRFIVAFFISVSTLGIYNLALLIVSTIGLFLLPLYNVLIPKLSELFSIQDHESILRSIRLTSNIVSMMYVPAALGIAALSRRILVILSNSQYLPASPPLIIFLIVSAVFIIGQVFVQAIYSIRKTQILFITASATLVSNVVLSILLIPNYGITGAAIANSSVTVVSFSILLWYTRLQGFLSFDIIGMLKIWFAAGIMALIVYLISGILPIGVLFLGILVILGTFLYILLLKIVKPVRLEDKSWILFLFSGRFKFLQGLIDRLI